MVELMTDVLGYDRFVAQGGDWGAFVSSLLGLEHAAHVDAIHLNLLPLRRDRTSRRPTTRPSWPRIAPSSTTGCAKRPATPSIQGTKPQTLAYALTDSPVGLAAWIVEKFQRWSDCDGDLARCFTRDELLTNVMLYWVTGAIGSSFWPYWARQHAGLAAPRPAPGRGSDRLRVVPEGHPPPAPRARRARLQHPALDGHAARRPLRRARTARAAGERRARLLPRPALTDSGCNPVPPACVVSTIMRSIFAFLLMLLVPLALFWVPVPGAGSLIGGFLGGYVDGSPGRALLLAHPAGVPARPSSPSWC